MRALARMRPGPEREYEPQAPRRCKLIMVNSYSEEPYQFGGTAYGRLDPDTSVM